MCMRQGVLWFLHTLLSLGDKERYTVIGINTIYSLHVLYCAVLNKSLSHHSHFCLGQVANKRV